MNSLASLTITDYATGYAEGRRAAKEHLPAFANPHTRNSPGYRGWADGHYDEHSARKIQIHRTSAAVWGRDDA